MRVTIPTLAAAISLMVFACSESPSSSNGDSSSSGGSSSSAFDPTEGRACAYSGEMYGLGSELFVCGEISSDEPGLYMQRAECEGAGGTLLSTCPSGEKATCIDEDDEDILIKLYLDDFACSDLGWKNADGSEDAKGGACGPFQVPGGAQLSQCTEYTELSTISIRAMCNGFSLPFADECPGNADLTCYSPEEEKTVHFYGKMDEFKISCEGMGMEELGK